MSAPVQIGRLLHRVRLQAPVDSDDGAGGTTRTWSDVATLWARIEPLPAAERIAAGRIEAAAGHRLTIRWRADVTHAMRVVFGTRVFSILGLSDVDARHRFLVCDCEEIAP